MARTQKLFYTTSCHCWGQGEGKGRESLPRSALSESAQRGSGITCRFFVPFVISIAAVAVCFLISFLFQVNWFYRTP